MPPTSSEQTRLRLLNAAAEEMLACGYAAAALSAIAARVGLTKGALGHHFPTKQAFATAIFDHVDEMADASARSARETFPHSGVRACIAYFAGLARSGASDAVGRAGLALYQDRSVPVEIAGRAFERSRGYVSGFLADHVEREGGALTMPPAAATLFLQMLIAGELTVARFVTDYSAEQAVLTFSAALTGMGVADAPQVVADGIAAVWGSAD